MQRITTPVVAHAIVADCVPRNDPPGGAIVGVFTCGPANVAEAIALGTWSVLNPRALSVTEVVTSSALEKRTDGPGWFVGVEPSAVYQISAPAVEQESVTESGSSNTPPFGAIAGRATVGSPEGESFRQTCSFV